MGTLEFCVLLPDFHLYSLSLAHSESVYIGFSLPFMIYARPYALCYFCRFLDHHLGRPLRLRHHPRQPDADRLRP